MYAIVLSLFFRYCPSIATVMLHLDTYYLFASSRSYLALFKLCCLLLRNRVRSCYRTKRQPAEDRKVQYYCYYCGWFIDGGNGHSCSCLAASMERQWQWPKTNVETKPDLCHVAKNNIVCGAMLGRWSDANRFIDTSCERIFSFQL